MESDQPEQKVDFVSLNEHSLEELLELEPPPTVLAAVAFKQLQRILEYVSDKGIGATTAVIERHYVDRDFMEDHSVFYSRSLRGYRNYCQRLHFFRGTPDSVQKQLTALVEAKATASPEEVRASRRKFSELSYCGFCVVKPLWGTPVGRTVLRTFPGQPVDANDVPMKGYSRHFHSTREYRTHLFGVELYVKGLAFQQQDIGVAACATTAIWSSLQQMREFEELGSSTPAHITAKATHASMPFGRSMPSEGLTTDQMCQAIQAFNASPVLSRVGGFTSGRAQLYSACRSGFAPIMIVSQGRNSPSHAIVAVGTKIGPTLNPASKLHDQDEDRLHAIYVHDDRFGPYLRATIRPGGLRRSELWLDIRTRKGAAGVLDKTEPWQVTHIITPTHHKIRLAISDLHALANSRIKVIGGAWRLVMKKRRESARVGYGVWITPSHTYLRELPSDSGFASDQAKRVGSGVPLSRYVGVIRYTFQGVGAFDILVDTTSTKRNPFFSAVVCSNTPDAALQSVARVLSKELGCRAF